MVYVPRSDRPSSRRYKYINLLVFATGPRPPIDFRDTANRQFRSEELIAYETGFRALATSHFYLDLALFYNSYRDLYSFQVGTPFLENTPSPAHAVIPLLTSNGIRGTTKGFEVTPDWKPVSWWELKTSYSHLEMYMIDAPGSNHPITAANYVRSSQ